MICIFDLIAYKKYVSQGLYLYICVVFIACISCDTGKTHKLFEQNSLIMRAEPIDYSCRRVETH